MAEGTRPERIGPWFVEGELGRGAMGVVFLARHEKTARRAAVKLLARTVAPGDESLARFRREGRLVARLGHPAIVPLLDEGIADGVPYLAFAQVPGGDLEALLRRKGSLPISVTVSLIRDLADALAAAHAAGVVHRDLKAANVLLDEAGRPHVADFGLARCLAEDGTLRTRTGQLLGTPIAMAPEQIRGDEAGPPADVYALGCLAYRCVTGRHPVEAEDLAELLRLKMEGRIVPPRQLRPDCPGLLSRRILACLDREAERRPDADALRDLPDVLAAESSAAPAPATATLEAAPMTPPPAAQAKRTRSLSAIPRIERPKRRPLLVAVLLLALLAAGSAFLFLRSPSPADLAPKEPIRLVWDLPGDRLVARWETELPTRGRLRTEASSHGAPLRAEEPRPRRNHELVLELRGRERLGPLRIEQAADDATFHALPVPPLPPPLRADALVAELAAEALVAPPADELIRELARARDGETAFPGENGQLAPAPTIRQGKALRWLSLCLDSPETTPAERIALLRVSRPFLWWEAIYGSLTRPVPDAFRTEERLAPSFRRIELAPGSPEAMDETQLLAFRDGRTRIVGGRIRPAKSARERPGRREGTGATAMIDGLGFAYRGEVDRRRDGAATGLGDRLSENSVSTWADVDLSDEQDLASRRPVFDLAVRRRTRELVPGWALWIAWHDGRTAPRLERWTDEVDGLERRRWKPMSERFFSLLMPLPPREELHRQRFVLPRGCLDARPYGLHVWIVRLSDRRTDFRPVIELVEARLGFRKD